MLRRAMVCACFLACDLQNTSKMPIAAKHAFIHDESLVEFFVQTDPGS